MNNKITEAQELIINGSCRIVYRPDRPLNCKATLWIETFSPVIPLIKEWPTAKAIPVEGFEDAKYLRYLYEVSRDTLAIAV